MYKNKQNKYIVLKVRMVVIWEDKGNSNDWEDTQGRFLGSGSVPLNSINVLHSGNALLNLTFTLYYSQNQFLFNEKEKKK